MKLSTTLFLGFILTGLSVYYVVSEKYLEANKTYLSPTKILELPSDDSISWLRIENKLLDETMSLRREGVTWSLELPVSSPAEGLLVDGMVAALNLSLRLRRFPLEEEPRKEFGLDSPKIRVGVETEKNPNRRFLLIGEDSPVNGTVFARWEGENEYFLIPSEVKASFNRTAYSLREKRLFKLDWAKTNWIHMKAGGKEFQIEKREDTWHWTLPKLEVEIPVEKVTDLFYAFQFLYVKEFLDGKNPDKGEWGFRGDSSFVALGGEGGITEKLILGNRVKGKDALYARLELENSVVLVSEANLKSLIEKFEIAYQELKNGNNGITKKY